MKGQINDINPQTNQGTILGEDGRQYPFNLQANNIGMMTKAGDTVEFLVDNSGFASNVQTALATTPPAYNPYQAPNQMGSIATRQGENPDWAIEENYGLVDWTKKCLQNYANFNGRARRKEYWFFYLATIIVGFIAGIIDGLLGTEGIIGGIITLAVFIPTLAVSVRRLHDIDKSGWWIFINLIPIIGWIIFLVWLATDTKPHANQWGLPARRV